MELWRTWSARLFGLGCLALGVSGLIVAFKEVTWKLGVVGYFTGGVLLGVVALMLMLDEYAESRRRSR